MWSADMPVEVLGLHVEREHVGEQRIQRTGDVPARIVAQIGGGGEGRPCGGPLQSFPWSRGELPPKSYDRRVHRASSKVG